MSWYNWVGIVMIFTPVWALLAMIAIEDWKALVTVSAIILGIAVAIIGGIRLVYLP